MRMFLIIGLEEQLKTVPDKPGVYLFKDAKQIPIYVGKARSLKKRMRSYFQKSSSLSPKTRALVENIDDFDYFVTDNEIEALILESNLIKKYKPHYNVSFCDDKSYPYIALSLSENFPRIFATREHHRKGFRYFGPYTKAYAMRDTLDVLRKIFPLRNCSNSKFTRAKTALSPCLYYHIKMCSAPCIGAMGKDEYKNLVKQIILFLEGRQEKVIADLEKKMKEVADKLEFEKAVRLRERIKAAKHVVERQKIVSTAKEDQDIIAIATNKRVANAAVLLIRGGKLIGSEKFSLNKGKADEEEVLTSFLKQFYSTTASIPKKIFLEREINDKALIEEWLSRKRGKAVTLMVPKKGEKKKLIKMASKNAAYALELHWAGKKFKDGEILMALNELKECFHMGCLPYRIEAFDISTIQGKESVGSMIVFEDGAPFREEYRKFKVKWVEGINDFAMMKEVVERRFTRYLKERNEPTGSFGQKPDLLVVDGGKPQLSAALAALSKLELGDISVVALAKKKEEIYLPEVAQPISLPRNSEGLNLLRRIRDEAHRFAVGYHRSLRSKRMVESALDEIPGVGEKRKKMLIKHFGSLRAVAKAEIEVLKEVLPVEVAKEVFNYFHTGKRI